ncbi:unnamed protein product, partial [Allacma fusca]
MLLTSAITGAINKSYHRSVVEFELSASS